MSFMAAREHGSKPGTGGHTSAAQENVDRRERLRRLALETIDISKDPYFMRNHLGQYECRLCLTVHKNEGSYLAHTQGRRHQGNLAKRAAREAAHDKGSASVAPRPAVVPVKKGGVKIGRPGYRVTKQYDPQKDQRSLLFQIEYPEIVDAVESPPRHRLMSCYEQRKEKPPDRSWQYVVFAAEPYETIAFKVPNAAVEKQQQKRGAGGEAPSSSFFVHWDSDAKIYSLQLPFTPGVKATVAESMDAAAAEQQQLPPPPQAMMMPPPPPPPPQAMMQMPHYPPPYPPPYAPPQQHYGYGGRGGGGGYYRGGGGGPPPPPPPPYYGR